MTIGSNNVENHPISSLWVQKALDRGATWIVVDPRYTRSAEMADIYCPLRSGTDIAFYGGLFNYIFEHKLYQHEYVLNYTNASYLLDKQYSFDVHQGIFSGFNKEEASYTTQTWSYQLESTKPWDTSDTGSYAWVNKPGVPAFTPPKHQVPKRDMTLQDPFCVFQQLKKHYARYDLETVSSTCGMEKELLEKVYATYAATGAPDKAGTILYALGQTQHHVGSQNCRAMAIVQLLLGNTGVVGGGVNALRGESNVQGATDMGMMVSSQPGYLNEPTEDTTPTLQSWCEHETSGDGYYTNKPKFIVSALKEWFGSAATAENDYGYDWWPKVPKTPDYTFMGSFELMREGKMKGYFTWGMNPSQSAPNSMAARHAMENLDWLVVVDSKLTETATFWEGPGMTPSQVNTSVYFLPAALLYEKTGSLANSGRWIQWSNAAVKPWDMAKPDYEICDLLWGAIVDLYKHEGGVVPEPILNAKWDYYVDGKIDPRPVAWALNGYKISGTDFSKGKAQLLSTFGDLEADGSTACGLWIYTGYYDNAKALLDPTTQPCSRRSLSDPSGLGLYSDFSFCWPLNRRIIYNRASCDAQGKPWNEKRKLVEWDGSKWIQIDVADFVTATNGKPVPPNDKAFFMLWEQNARLETTAMSDGPFPEHYEPYESPAHNQLNGSQNSPCIRFTEFDSVKRGDPQRYPIAITTYQITEQWLSGTETRSTPALVEAMPYQFVEISKELAHEKGIKNGDLVRVFNNRGEVKVNALVTVRFKPFMVEGKTVHQVGMTHTAGWSGLLATGDVTNNISINVGDPNCLVPEYKAFLVDIEKV